MSEKKDDKNTTRTNKRMKTSVYLLNRVTVSLIRDKHLTMQYRQSAVCHESAKSIITC